MGETPLCDGHGRRFGDRRRRKGYTLERFLAELAHRGLPCYVFEGLPEPLRSELQFGLQCFSDRRTTRLAMDVFVDVLAGLRERGDRSLLDAIPSILDEVSRRSVPFLRFVHDRLEQLADAYAGREEWDRDEWRVGRLGIETYDKHGPALLASSNASCQTTSSQRISTFRSSKSSAGAVG